MVYKNIIYNFLALVYVFSFNFQNVKFFPQAGSISMIGEYYLLPISCLIYFFKKKECSNKISKIYKNYIVYFVIISIFMNIAFYIFLNKIEIYGELFSIKSIHLFLHLVFQFISINALFYIFKQVKFKNIKWILNINFIFLTCYFIYERYFLKEIGRIKLLTPEPSIAGFLISIIFFITFYINKELIVRFFLSCIYLLMLYYTGSKGAILCLVISFVIYIAINFRQNKKLMIFLCFFIILFFKVFFYEKIINLFMIDIEKYTSLVTRSWSIITAIITTLILSFGSSGGYLFTYSFFGEIVKKIYIYLFPRLNYSEIDFMLKTGMYLVPKAGIFFGFLISGIGYIYILVSIFRYLYKNLKNEKILYMLLICYFISSLIYISDMQTPIQILIYSFLLRIIKFNEKGRKNADKLY